MQLRQAVYRAESMSTQTQQVLSQWAVPRLCLALSWEQCRNFQEQLTPQIHTSTNYRDIRGQRLPGITTNVSDQAKAVGIREGSLLREAEVPGSSTREKPLTTTKTSGSHFRKARWLGFKQVGRKRLHCF